LSKSLEEAVAERIADRGKLRAAAVDVIAGMMPPDTLGTELSELTHKATSGQQLGELEPLREALTAVTLADLVQRVKERAAASA